MQVRVIIMIPAQVVVETKIITILSLHLNPILKVLKETATQRNMCVERPAGKAAMMEIEAVRAWDTVLIKYAQGRYVNES